MGEDIAFGQALKTLGLSHDAAVEGRLEAYLKLLQQWNAAYNLTAIRDPAAMRVQHIMDCLAVVPNLLQRLPEAPRSIRVLDVGSGGGLPGVILAILQPTWQVHCIDTVGKKVAFVRQVAGELGLPNLHAIHGRVERLRAWPESSGFGPADGASETGSVEGFDLVVSRAFASLADFVQWTHAALRPGLGVWAAMKSKRSASELATLPAGLAELVAVDGINVPGLDAERCVVWLKQPARQAPTS